MSNILNITNGDSVVAIMKEAGIGGVHLMVDDMWYWDAENKEIRREIK